MSVARKSLLGEPVNDTELDELVSSLGNRAPTADELAKQKVSFVFGNSSKDSKVTKEKAKAAVESMLMR